jgi:hypothetical protein
MILSPPYQVSCLPWSPPRLAGTTHHDDGGDPSGCTRDRVAHFFLSGDQTSRTVSGLQLKISRVGTAMQPSNNGAGGRAAESARAKPPAMEEASIATR